MALTQGAWTNPAKSVNGKAVTSCVVTATEAENDAYTLRTPDFIDCAKPFTLMLTFSGTPDGSELPLDLWVGYGTNFEMTGDGGTLAATDGAFYKTIFDDVVLAVDPLIYTFLIDPTLIVEDVVTVGAIATGPKVKTPPVPYLAFNLNGESTLEAESATWTIVQ
jgi:hypothetical protein